SPTCGRAPTRTRRCGPRPRATPARSPSPPPAWSPTLLPGENEPVTPDLWPAQLWPTLLAEAWAALSADSGLGDARLPAGLEVLSVSGAPGNLPSRLPAEDVAIACAGTALLAAAALRAQRGEGTGGSDVGRRCAPTLAPGGPAARLGHPGARPHPGHRRPGGDQVPRGARRRCAAARLAGPAGADHADL